MFLEAPGRIPLPGQQGDDLPAESPCFRINELKLETPDGRSYGQFRDLQRELDRYAGRCIGREGINLIVRRLSSRILANGYSTTRLGVPEQDLRSGTLRLLLIPGVIRSIRFSNDSLRGTWANAFPARPGDVLNLRDLEQGLEQMKRLPSQEVNIRILPGDQPGESDVLLDVTRGKTWHLGGSMDDSGSEATGRLQGTLDLAIDNPLGLSDAFSVNLNRDLDGTRHIRGTEGSGAAYSIPWGYWTITASISDYDYHQKVAGGYQVYTSSGRSRTRELRIARLVHRTQTSKDTLQFRTWTRGSHAYLDDTEIDVQWRKNSHVELSWSRRQHFRNAQLDVSLAHRQGVSWFNAQADWPGSGPDRPTFYYRMQTLDATLAVPFTLRAHPMQYRATFRGQYSPDALYATEQFTLGNRWTVRGFDGETTLAAEKGWFLRNELEVPLGRSGSAFYLALDGGRVSGPSAKHLLGRSLVGTAVGLRGELFNHFSYDVFLGGPVHQPSRFPNHWMVAGFSLAYRR